MKIMEETKDNESTTNTSPENEQIEEDKLIRAVDNQFKKPLLVGKIGRLPKKLQTIPVKVEPSKQDIAEENIGEVSDESHQTVSTLTPIIPNPKTEALDHKTTKKSETHNFQYNEPEWSGVPKTPSHYFLKLLKNGVFRETFNLVEHPYWVFGRTEHVHVHLLHPTISRYHAVLQYRDKPSETEAVGYYIYDLNSTHGTFLNRKRIKPRVYVRVKVGYLIRFGASTRDFILTGPEEDEEQEVDLTVTEWKKKKQDELDKIKEEQEELERERQREIAKRKMEEEERLKKEEDKGVDWGMGEDADEETDLSVNPFAQTANEDLYLDDPKKTLRGFFEREGLDLNYDCSDHGMGQFKCRVSLPLDDEKGQPMYAEVIHKGKKKEAVVQCALEACRLLDRHGLLRQAQHESRKRKAKDWAENDYYDSDDDTFLDRTGAIEKKREKRMNAKVPQKAETYESLLAKERQCAESIANVELGLREAHETLRTSNSAKSEEDSLDAFMKDLKNSRPDKSSINKLKAELAKLKQEHAKIIKLVNVARPASLPPLVAQYSTDESSIKGKSKTMPLFGKRLKIPVNVPKKSSMEVGHVSGSAADSTIEEVEEEEETEKNAVTTSSMSGIIEDEVHVNSGGKTVDVEEPEGYSEEKLDYKQFYLGKCLDRVKMTEKEIIKISSMLSNEDDFRKFHSLVCNESYKINKKIAEFLASSSQNRSPKEEKIEVTDKKQEGEEMNDKKNDEVSCSDEAKKNKNQRRINQRLGKAEIEKMKGYAEDARKEDYNMWVPPNDQKGDGKTKLNEKYGY